MFTAPSRLQLSTAKNFMKLFTNTTLTLTKVYMLRRSFTPYRNIRKYSNVAGQNLLTQFEVSSEVRSAIAEHEPVVALESAIITHGMPFPTNIETALGIQNIIRRKGAIPATVGVIEGKVKVGLSDDEIEFLGSSVQSAPVKKLSASSTVKVSRRDFPFVLSKKLNGGTTVAGTLIAAAKAGIPIFATGGIGGVHRGANLTFDISCDLKELGRHSMAVVSAGVKSILDIGKTLEYLETEGVSVCVLQNKGPQDMTTTTETSLETGSVPPPPKFPSFFTSQSPFESPWSVDNEIQAASIVHSTLTFGLGSGILIAVPIPKELEASGESIEAAIAIALEKAKMAGICGKEMTPFLLSEINMATGGESLKANRALIENNVSVAASIAIELSKLQKNDIFDNGTGRGPLPYSTLNEGNKGTLFRTKVPQSNNEDDGGKDQKNLVVEQKSSLFTQTIQEQHHRGHGSGGAKVFPLPLRSGRPVIIGGSSLDIMMTVQESEIVTDGRTHTGKIVTAAGAVGRNVAEALRKLGQDPLLITTIGTDPIGSTVLENFESCKMDTSGIHFCSDSTTAIYAGILNCVGECMYGIGDMRMHGQITPNIVQSHSDEIKSASIVLIDANISVETIETVMRLCTEHNVPLWFEPTELRKAQRLLEVSRDFWPSLSFMSPNLKELQSLLSGSASSAVKNNRDGGLRRSDDERSFDPSHPSLQDINTIVSQSFAQFTGLSLILLTRGSEGFILAHRHFEDSKDQRLPQFSMYSFPKPEIPESQIRSVSGAGDCLNAGFISGLIEGLTLENCAIRGTECAADSLRSLYAVPLNFTTPKVSCF